MSDTEQPKWFGAKVVDEDIPFEHRDEHIELCQVFAGSKTQVRIVASLLYGNYHRVVDFTREQRVEQTVDDPQEFTDTDTTIHQPRLNAYEIMADMDVRASVYNRETKEIIRKRFSSLVNAHTWASEQATDESVIVKGYSGWCDVTDGYVRSISTHLVEKFVDEAEKEKE